MRKSSEISSFNEINKFCLCLSAVLEKKKQIVFTVRYTKYYKLICDVSKIIARPTTTQHTLFKDSFFVQAVDK